MRTTEPLEVHEPAAPGERRGSSRALKPLLSADEIRALLPHSWPFLFLDRVLEMEPPQRAVGTKNVSISEPYFAGHFPSASVMPGVLVIESLAQLIGVMLVSAPSAVPVEQMSGDAFMLAEVRRMRFRRPIRPGDCVELHANRTGAAGRVAEYEVRALVDGERAADGSLSVWT